jgi:hypothetical protein
VSPQSFTVCSIFLNVPYVIRFSDRLILRLPLLFLNQHLLGANLPLITVLPLSLILLDPATITEAVLNATNGIGVDVAFDAAGSQEGLDSALPSIRPRGIFLDVGVFEESPRVNMNLIVMREITLAGKFFFFSLRMQILGVNWLNRHSCI